MYVHVHTLHHGVSTIVRATHVKGLLCISAGGDNGFVWVKQNSDSISTKAIYTHEVVCITAGSLAQ